MLSFEPLEVAEGPGEEGRAAGEGGQGEEDQCSPQHRPE